MVLSAVACTYNLSIHPMNKSPIIKTGFLQPIIDLLAFEASEGVQFYAVSTLRSLAGGSEESGWAICKTSAARSIKKLVLGAPIKVQREMTACIAVLALNSTYPPFDRHIRTHPPQTSSRVNYWRRESVRF